MFSLIFDKFLVMLFNELKGKIVSFILLFLFFFGEDVSGLGFILKRFLLG